MELEEETSRDFLGDEKQQMGLGPMPIENKQRSRKAEVRLLNGLETIFGQRDTPLSSWQRASLKGKNSCFRVI